MPPFHEEQLFRRAIAGDQQQQMNDRYPSKYQHQYPAAPPVAPVSSNRTQHKLQLQRLSFLTNDKNYLDHPKNMKRLTKELDRVNREYRCVRRYEDPVSESFKRLNQKAACARLIQPQTNNPTPTSTTATTIKNKISNSASSSSISSNSNTSSNSSSYSSSAEQNSFLSRWFTNQQTDNNHPTDDVVSQHASVTGSVAYSFHPTIASNMKRRTKH
ncbi:unnamed protein product [Mucor hiemalis]